MVVVGDGFRMLSGLASQERGGFKQSCGSGCVTDFASFNRDLLPKNLFCIY